MILGPSIAGRSMLIPAPAWVVKDLGVPGASDTAALAEAALSTHG